MFTVVELTAYLRSAVTALLALAAVFVVSRWMAGALKTPLGPFPLLVAGVLLAGLARMAHAPAQAGRFPAGGVMTSVATLALAASLSLSGGNVGALLGFWAVIVGEELWAWRGSLPDRRVAPPPGSAPVDGNLTDETEPAEPAANVLQQLTLRTTADGNQELSGWLRIRFDVGQRSGSLHVAFCPPFGQVPLVQAEALSGPDCRIKAAQVLPYGVRLDVKLDEPAGERESVLVWFFAAVSWPSPPGPGS